MSIFCQNLQLFKLIFLLSQVEPYNPLGISPAIYDVFRHKSHTTQGSH